MQKKFTKLLLGALMTTMLTSGFIGTNHAAAQTRSESAAVTMEQLYEHKTYEIIPQDKELNSIMQKFIYSDINQQVKMSPKQQELLTLAVLTASNAPQEIPLHVRGALQAGATPEQVRETIFHCTPYVGMLRAKAAICALNKALKKCGIKSLADAGTVTDATRHDAGLAVQRAIFPNIDKSNATASIDEKHFRKFLSANCFGDYYTRNGLDVKERELITFTAIISLGGCESQARSHVNGNLTVGNTRQQLIDAITIALPYIGYPRTLNALACINAIVPTQK